MRSSALTFYRYPGAADATTYEWENRTADPDQRIEAFMTSVAPFAGRTIVDIGGGSAFHASRYAREYPDARVLVVEPDADMLAQAFRRLADAPLGNLSIIAANAEDIPLRDGIADIVHSRFAYFFGPAEGGVKSCEPGIREALRLLAPGGVFFVIDNSLTDGDFARFLRQYGWNLSADGHAEQTRRDAFWFEQGFQKQTVASAWVAPNRDVLRQIITMEFPADAVEPVMNEIDASLLSYSYDVYWRWKE